MSQHSQIIGGSTADRVIGCPGSVAAIAALPELLETSSDYADEGSALHQVMADLVEGTRELPAIGSNEKVALDNGKVIVITDDLIRDALEPAWDWLSRTLEAYGGDKHCDVVVEQRVEFPGVPGAFGTCDVILHARNFNTTLIVDWKFGAGVPVTATYPSAEDPAAEYVNRQLMFYAAAARHSCPEFFPGDDMTIMAIVCQPRAFNSEARISTAEILAEELDQFENLIVHAVELAQMPQAPLVIGPWCRFAPCRPYCPLHRAGLVELVGIDKLDLARPKPNHGEQLAHILEVGEKIEEVLAEARRQAHLILENGGVVPGWGLVPKRANRQWTVEEKALAAALKPFKIKPDDMYERKLKSPAQMEKLLPKKTKLPDGVCAAISTGTTLARGESTVPTLRDAKALLAQALKDS